MRKLSVFVTFLILSFIVIGAANVHYLAYQGVAKESSIIQQEHPIMAGFESENISISLLSPENRSGISGPSLLISINITSTTGPWNLTLFIEDEIHPSYNRTLFGTGVQGINIDTTTLIEGNLNFTLLFENETYSIPDRESLFLVFFVDNIAPNLILDLLNPANRSRQSGSFQILMNITSDFDYMNFTLYVEDEPYPSYNHTLIVAESQTFTIDSLILREGPLNFTLFFEYNVSNVYDYESYYLIFLIDNDGQPLTLTLLSPANTSAVSGIFNITLDIASDFGPVNLTLYIEGGVYSLYNRTPISPGIRNITVNTTTYEEGNLNFTFFVSYNSTLNLTYSLIFDIDNHGVPSVIIIGPDADGNFTGIANLSLNITSTYANVYLNITVDGLLVPEYNSTIISIGLANYSVNGSRYENGFHTVEVTVWTEEGLESSASIRLNFLDHVRFAVTGLTNYGTIAGYTEIQTRVFSPYPNVTLSVYVDNEIIEDIVNITIPAGSGSFFLNATMLSEGEHSFTFKTYDAFGHVWEYHLLLIVDNHGAPAVEFVAMTDDIVVGLAEFTILVESTWENVNLTVYVDDEEVPGLVSLVIPVGEYSFKIDTGAYSKWEHDVKVEIVTDEGESAEIVDTFGFASIKIEEVVSLVVLLTIALLIPIVRWRRGQRIRNVIIVDLLYAIVVAGLFIILGVNSYPLAIWHFNLPSVWAIGVTLVFANWVIPFFTGEAEEFESSE